MEGLRTYGGLLNVVLPEAFDEDIAEELHLRVSGGLRTLLRPLQHSALRAPTAVHALRTLRVGLL
eukprot:2720841-Alexandrium_andersonii.AAC.1